jgi:hypothetical protein
MISKVNMGKWHKGKGFLIDFSLACVVGKRTFFGVEMLH